MKYCFRYQKYNSSFMKCADEILIHYRPEDTTFLDFLNLYKDKRIIVSLDEKDYSEQELEKLNLIYQKNNNFVLRLQNFSIKIIDTLKKYNIPFFIFKFANNWDTFRGLINLGVSDIYITDSLGFELDKCAKEAHEKNINIRVFPNVAQSQWDLTQSIKKFFIRPDDIDIYGEYVDVFEFICNLDQEEPLYKIYKDKNWFGKLNEIITFLDSEVDNYSIIPASFGTIRAKCGKTCMSAGNCRLCDEIEMLSAEMAKKEYYIDKEGGKEDGIKR